MAQATDKPRIYITKTRSGHFVSTIHYRGSKLSVGKKFDIPLFARAEADEAIPAFIAKIDAAYLATAARLAA